MDPHVTATYRLQMHAGFTFADAEAQVPYLADLGITHLYLSPVLQAAPGSMHGYDVVDHTRVSADLGGEAGLVSLGEAARRHGLGVVVDVVPIPVAMVAPEHLNEPLWQVLHDGRDAPTAHWFDVDWDAGGGKLGLPVLGGPLADVLAAGEIKLEEYDGRPALRYYDHLFPVAKGTEDDDLATVLDRQHYRLASWREKDTVLNYRRFFDVDTLIAVRVEEPDVFDATHRVLLDLNHRGLVDGLRIDHPDGLADPEGYLRMLRKATRPGTAIWVEKILEGDERLPDEWPCDGTTGYDALRAVTAAFVDPSAAPALTEAWSRADGDPDLHSVELTAKRLVVADLLGPEVQRLTRRATEALPDTDSDRVADAVVELLVGGEVYRAYLWPGQPLTTVAESRLRRAHETAVEARPDLRVEIGQVAKLMRGEHAADFAIRLQQTWGPVMAKGIEDTTFYRWHRLVALNEVGGDPAVLESASPEALHEWAAAQQQDWPRGLTALSTHDTKRSEDVRARLLAVAGDAESWERCSQAFAAAADETGVDRPTAHLLWQTLVGVGFIPSERLHDYLIKAVREAKQHTAWVDGDEDYEARVLALADRATAPGELHDVIAGAVEANADGIRATILAAKLLQLCLPGVPDTYQGCEVVDLSLVDPDNRRPVDYAVRAARLARLDDGSGAVDLDDEKLLTTARALRLRRRSPEIFGEGASYDPLPSTSEHALGFVRSAPQGRVASALGLGRPARVACVVTRAPHRLEHDGGWGEATITLPEGEWRDELTGRVLSGGTLPVADVLPDLPVALLVSR